MSRNMRRRVENWRKSCTRVKSRFDSFFETLGMLTKRIPYPQDSGVSSPKDGCRIFHSNRGYMYPNLRILSIAFSLSCRLPPLSSVFTRSCSQAGTPSTDIRLVVLAPRER